MAKKPKVPKERNFIFTSMIAAGKTHRVHEDKKHKKGRKAKHKKKDNTHD